MANATQGEQRTNAKLTVEAVRRARTLYRNRWSLRSIAAMYGVSDFAVGSAVWGDTWAHVTDPPPVPKGLRPHNWRQLAKERER